MKDETVSRLREDCRTSIRISLSDKEVFNQLKPQGMSDWQFFRKLLALGMTAAKDNDGGVAA